MLDKFLWALRWLVGVGVGCVLVTWLAAVVLALAGFKKTAEAVNEIFLQALPFAAVLIALLVIALATTAVVRWLRGPTSTRPQA